ncbi:MAG: efflux RND transporter periplasmic adaptor subunit [Verrucomicrobiales bacterium]|nr:efflux RND transporter periplasmic adaptor subunit [Verrucomicrobiales bacterium]
MNRQAGISSAEAVATGPSSHPPNTGDGVAAARPLPPLTAGGNGRGKLKKRRRWPWILGAILLLLVVVGLVGARLLTRSVDLPPEKLVRVERGDIARSVVAVGQVEPLSKVELKSKANGIIQALLVDVGDSVEEGQILAELDKDYLDAQVRQAKAIQDSEEANLKVALAAEARASIEAVNPETEFLRRDLERVQALVQSKIASPQDLDDAQRNYEMSVNRKRLLEASARSAQASVVQARARAAAAQASLDQAEENRRHATIRSPIRGVVLTRDTEVGDAVSSILNLGSAATLIMTLGDMSSVYVEGQIDEADVGKIQHAMPVRTKVESFPNEPFAGTVTRIAPMGRKKDNVTTFEVRVSIANPGGKLRANMSANAEVVLEERKGVLLIPEAAVVHDKDGKTSVQIRDAASKTGYRSNPVKTGISNGQRREVLEGVGEGTELVLP